MEEEEEEEVDDVRPEPLDEVMGPKLVWGYG